MVQIINEFDTTDITDASIQFINADGSTEPGTSFGCIGSISGDPEVVTIEKRCGSRTIKSKTKTNKLDMTISGHIPLSVARNYFGMTNDKLKTGIWAAGTLTKGKDFILTVTAVDDFGENEKLIAFPNASNTSGFRIQPMEAGVEEVAMLELTFSALPDELNYFYYEAIVAELEDPTVAELWHTDFDRTLVEDLATP